jgi:hypothetical protein
MAGRESMKLTGSKRFARSRMRLKAEALQGKVSPIGHALDRRRLFDTGTLES